MSETPLEAVFQLQREAIRQTETVAEEMIRLPTEVGDLFTEGARTQRELQEQAFAVSRQSVHRSLDAVESVVGAGEVESLRESVDQAFETLQDQQEAACEAVESESETVSADLLAQVDEQADLLIEFNEQVEQQLADLLDEVPEDAAVPDGIVGEFERQLEAITEQFTTQFEATTRGSDPTEIEIESADDDGTATPDDGE